MAPRSVLAGRSKIHDSCFIGAGATIIDYLDVCSNTTLGAGATLLKAFPSLLKPWLVFLLVQYLKEHDIFLLEVSVTKQYFFCIRVF